MSIPNNIPEGVLKLIIKEMVKDGFEPSMADSLYEDSTDLDRIDYILKKFGITGTDLYEYGFYTELLSLNYDEKTETIISPLIIPKKFHVNVWFDVDMRKQITEKWKLPLQTYNTDRSYISDMMSAGDISYHDGEFFDDEVNDSDIDDWNISHIDIKDLKESKKKKNVISEGKKIYFRKFEKELPTNVLKLILKKLISNITNELGVDYTSDDPYISGRIQDVIDDTLKLFGIINLNWEEYGFFWKLFLDNRDYEDGDELEIPNLKLFEVEIEERVTRWGDDFWKHEIYSYDENFVENQISHDDNFDLYNGHFLREVTDDSETRGQEVIRVNEIPLGNDLTESQKTKKLIKENNDSELTRLQKLKEQIEKRIKEITS